MDFVPVAGSEIYGPKVSNTEAPVSMIFQWSFRNRRSWPACSHRLFVDEFNHRPASLGDRESARQP
jgi:hypothetical protein